MWVYSNLVPTPKLQKERRKKSFSIATLTASCSVLLNVSSASVVSSTELCDCQKNKDRLPFGEKGENRWVLPVRERSIIFFSVIYHLEGKVLVFLFWKENDLLITLCFRYWMWKTKNIQWGSKCSSAWSQTQVSFPFCFQKIWGHFIHSFFLLLRIWEMMGTKCVKIYLYNYMWSGKFGALVNTLLYALK